MSDGYEVYWDDHLVVVQYLITGVYTNETNIILYVNCNWKIKKWLKVDKEKKNRQNTAIFKLL